MSEIDIFPDWQTLPGTILDGGYELKEIVDAERGRAAIRVRVLGDYTLKALASFYVLQPAAAKKQVELWEAIRHFERRQELSSPLGAGILSLNGITLGYVVLQTPDESLADAVNSRALTGEEAQEVVRSTARALQELHSNGMVHGSVSPEEIQAIGDAIKLSTESVREVSKAPIVERKSAKYVAPENQGYNSTTASDLWCLGATLFETLTQKTYEPGLYEEAADLRHPFGTLAAACLDPDPEKRCKLSEIDGILRSKTPPPKPKPAVAPVVTAEPEKEPTPEAAAEAPTPAPVAAPPKPEQPNPPKPEQPNPPKPEQPNPPKPEQPKTTIPETTTPVAKAATAAAAAPSPIKLPNEPVSGPKLRNEPVAGRKLPNEPSSFGAQTQKWRNEATEPSDTRRRGWIYALSAFIVILLILFVARSRSAKKTVAQPLPSPTTSTAPAPRGDAKPAWPTKTLSPDTKTPAPSPTTSTPTPAVAAKTGGGAKTIWRVVLYTYRKQEDAQRQVDTLSKTRPDLQVEVFPASPEGGPYLVVAGGRMNRAEANQVRQRAVHEGMPPDSYIQNFDR